MKATRRGPVGATAVLVISVLHAGATFSITRQSDVNLVSGVWLALARDLCDGLFYRDLITPSEYGGTRYFPLFVSLVDGFGRAGLGTCDEPPACRHPGHSWDISEPDPATGDCFQISDPRNGGLVIRF